jgi:hypothetical protein
MGPDGAQNQEWMRWRRPTANYCFALWKGMDGCVCAGGGGGRALLQEPGTTYIVVEIPKNSGRNLNQDGR